MECTDKSISWDTSEAISQGIMGLGAHTQSLDSFFTQVKYTGLIDLRSIV